ncbi:hypothetical protein ACP4OV_029468 [Aristida adscensionis]
MDRVKRKPVLICCGVFLAIVVVLAVLAVTLYFTVFRPRAPRVDVTVVRTEIPVLRPFPPALNLTIHAEITANNPNYAAFRYGDVVTVLRYHGENVGQSVVPAGEIGARAARTVAATMDVDTVKVVATPDFLLKEAWAGVLPFQTQTTVAGKAIVLGRFEIPARSEVACEVTVSITNTTTQCTATVHVGR